MKKATKFREASHSRRGRKWKLTMDFIIIVFGILVVVLGLFADVTRTSDFISKHLSIDGVLEKQTLRHLKVLQLSVIAFGFLLLISGILIKYKRESLRRLIRLFSNTYYSYNGRKVVLAIFLVALLLRLSYVIITNIEPISDARVYDITAQNLVAGKGYYNEYGLRAYRAPGYPLFLSAIFLSFGINNLPVQIIQAIIGSLTCIIWYLIGKELNNPKGGIITALLISFYLPLIRYCELLLSETLFIFLLSLAFFGILRSLKQSSFLLNITIGILLSISMLVRPIIALFLLFVLIFVSLVSFEKKANRIKDVAVIAFSIIIVVSPWTIRNYVVFKKFVPLTTNGGINFYIGNNSNATGTYYIPENWSKTFYGLSETERNQKGYEEGSKFIRQNPYRFLKLFVKKELLFWSYPIGIRNVLNFSLPLYLVISFGGLVGMILSLRQWRKFFLLYAFICYYLLMHGIFFTAQRFRLPVMPVLALFAGITINHLLDVGLGKVK